LIAHNLTFWNSI